MSLFSLSTKYLFWSKCSKVVCLVPQRGHVWVSFFRGLECTVTKLNVQICWKSILDLMMSHTCPYYHKTAILLFCSKMANIQLRHVMFPKWRLSGKPKPKMAETPTHFSFPTENNFNLALNTVYISGNITGIWQAAPMVGFFKDVRYIWRN